MSWLTDEETRRQQVITTQQAEQRRRHEENAAKERKQAQLVAKHRPELQRIDQTSRELIARCQTIGEKLTCSGGLGEHTFGLSLRTEKSTPLEKRQLSITLKETGIEVELESTTEDRWVSDSRPIIGATISTQPVRQSRCHTLTCEKVTANKLEEWAGWLLHRQESADAPPSALLEAQRLSEARDQKTKDYYRQLNNMYWWNNNGCIIALVLLAGWGWFCFTTLAGTGWEWYGLLGGAFALFIGLDWVGRGPKAS